MTFGFTIGHVESQLWISSLVTGMAMTYVVSDPLKIFFRMGLMPVIAAGILVDSGLFNALGSETLALGAMAVVGASGVAQYVAKRTEKKRLKRAKASRLVPTDQGVFVRSHRMVQCRAGCAMFLEARSRNGHELSQCRLTMCNCGKMVLTKSLELHQQRECRNKTVFCRLNCGASVPSHQRERHERHECARRIATDRVRAAPSKVAASHAIVVAYSPSPVSPPPKLNAAAIRGPPIPLIRSADTKPQDVLLPLPQAPL
ncbi:hypothetical protein FI667_g8755, partial [Globisporangium splendens]